MSVSSGAFLAEITQRHQARQIHGSQRSLPSASPLISFSDNDYLSLSYHPEVIAAAARALQDYGTGAKAARLLAGPCPEHRLLEEELAQWKGSERALLFASGYLTPLGVLPALLGSNDTIILERQCHACLFDGARLSGARLRLFGRQDLGELQQVLLSTRKLHPQGKILIVVESLHSMDGDFAPLAEIIRHKEAAGAWLLLDEAHAGGLRGPQGAGLAADLRLHQRIELQMGTLGKALGSSGGFIAASSVVIDSLLNEARTFLFGTALAPSSAAAARAALRIIQCNQGLDLRQKLQENIILFRSQIPTSSVSPIQPLFCGSNQRAIEASQSLRQSGLTVPAIRTPTVPQDTARLRISLSSRHQSSEINLLSQALRALPPFLPC